MTPLAKTMELVFIAAWFVGVGAWLYATRFWLAMWAVSFDRSKRPPGYMRKALVGYGIFIAAVAVGFVAGGIAEFWGGGWH
jgi:hypothetical protein